MSRGVPGQSVAPIRRSSARPMWSGNATRGMQTRRFRPLYTARCLYKSLRILSAMASGVADRLWAMGGLSK